MRSLPCADLILSRKPDETDKGKLQLQTVHTQSDDVVYRAYSGVYPHRILRTGRKRKRH